MFTRIRFISIFWLALVFFLLTPKQSTGQERLCDPSFEDCYSPLLDLVNAENVGIDMAFYMIELPGLANAIIARHQAGVPVRIIVEPRANLKFPGNQPILDQFNAAGIPMRYKLGDGIVHVKVMLLAGQNKVVFTGSNFGDGDVRPYEPYANYVDGAWYIASDVITGTLGPSGSESYLVSGLQNGSTYYWRIVGKTMANQTATGPVWRFTTSGTTSPSPTVSAVSPNSGTTAGGTSVTITGTNFVAGVTVTFGGTAALNVTVTNATTITASTPAHAVGAVSVAVTNSDGQSGALANGFTYTAVTETTLLEDNFNDNSIDFSKWTPNNLFSGFTDPNVPTNETSQQLQIGALLQGQSGSHYNGIRSTNTYDFTGAYCYVELVQAAASSTKADAMLTLGRDVSNYYRIYIEEGTLICQARIAGVKRNLFTAAYDPSAHRYWRIRHDQATGKVVFETAPDNSGAPGSWTLRYSEQWDTASVPLASIVFEIKAGTWQVETVVPGTVAFDNFRLARQL